MKQIVKIAQRSLPPPEPWWPPVAGRSSRKPPSIILSYYYNFFEHSIIASQSITCIRLLSDITIVARANALLNNMLRIGGNLGL